MSLCAHNTTLESLTLALTSPTKAWISSPLSSTLVHFYSAITTFNLKYASKSTSSCRSHSLREVVLREEMGLLQPEGLPLDFLCGTRTSLHLRRLERWWLLAAGAGRADSESTLKIRGTVAIAMRRIAPLKTSNASLFSQRRIPRGTSPSLPLPEIALMHLWEL
jgi:hypothetical protein